MKKIGYGLLIILSLNVFTSCEENTDFLKTQPIQTTDGTTGGEGGDEDEDDPVNSGGNQ